MFRINLFKCLKIWGSGLRKGNKANLETSNLMQLSDDPLRVIMQQIQAISFGMKKDKLNKSERR